MDQDEKKTSADKAKARHCAAGLLKSSKVTESPVIVNTLVSQVKADFDLLVSPAPSQIFRNKGDAMTQRRGSVTVIVYDDTKPVSRKRFSVVHEIGHIYLGHLDGCSSVELNTDNFDEIEANTFAANVLMPKKFLMADIKGGLNANELARKYQVSEEALWYQLKESGLINSLYKYTNNKV